MFNKFKISFLALALAVITVLATSGAAMAAAACPLGFYQPELPQK